jgi:hypothetical protein
MAFSIQQTDGKPCFSARANHWAALEARAGLIRLCACEYGIKKAAPQPTQGLKVRNFNSQSRENPLIQVQESINSHHCCTKPARQAGTKFGHGLAQVV